MSRANLIENSVYGNGEAPETEKEVREREDVKEFWADLKIHSQIEEGE